MTQRRRTGLAGIEDKLFTERHLRFYGSGALAAFALAMFLSWGLYHHDWVVRPDGTLSNIDFCWIWVSGKFAVGDPSHIYDHAPYSAAQDVFYPPGQCLFLHQYVYPPTFLFFSFPLGLMPYLTAFGVWVFATFVLYEAAIFAIVPRLTALIAAVISGAVLKNIELGHAGFLIAGLIGLSLVFIERRPWLSGIFLGLLTCKPQYGVLFPLALAASRNWRALGSAAVMSIIFGLAAGIAFGFRAWPSFIATLFDRNAGLSPDGQVELSLQSVYGLLHWAGAGASISWAVHAAVAAAVALAVLGVWAKPVPYSLKAAALCAGTIMFTPYMLAYDLCILSIGVAFLVRDGISRGFLPGERSTMFVCWGGLFNPATPVAPIISAALLLLVLRRITAGSRLDRAREPDRRNFVEMKPVAVD
jgi:arabinofuranan 3-O-arabinosyltransferase